MTSASAWPIPPHVQLKQFLDPLSLATLLDWVRSNRRGFRNAAVVSQGRPSTQERNSAVRIALTLSDLGPLRQMLEARLWDALPTLIAGTGYQGPEPTDIELELAAHGDGAHFAPHVDIPLGTGRMALGPKDGLDRVLSAVLYFFNEPKRFSGGCLRLHRIGHAENVQQDYPETYRDVEPVQNSLVAFPSWALHEVRKVACPTGDFADYRFALNCWYCRTL